jgi:uncharacterized membrane protein YhaH (DUF805 family)
MLNYFLSPKGRFRRRDYWFGMIVMMIILAIGLSADFVFRGVEIIPTGGPGDFIFQPAPLLLGVAGLLILWPSIAMGIKRWHDRDKSGWFVLLGMIPIVNLYAYISLFLLPGTRNLNRFGPDPREEERYLYASEHDTTRTRS